MPGPGPYTESIVRWVRRLASPVLGDRGNDAADIAVDSATDEMKYASSGTARTVVTTALTQTLTNKTLTSPTLTTPTLNGGTVPGGQQLTVAGTLALTGNFAGNRMFAERDGTATRSLAASESGRVIIATASSGTQVFTLPAASTLGLMYTFVCGHASGEIRLAVGTGDNIVGKTHGANDATGLVSTATTGLLLNTAATNVVGDFVTVVADGTTTWYMTAVAGVWSAT